MFLFNLLKKHIYFLSGRILVLVTFLSLFFFSGAPVLMAACITLPTEAIPLAGGTYSGSQMFRIDANDGDSLRVHIPENASAIYMILYAPMSSTQACETLRGNNREGDGTKTLEYDFPYSSTWYLEIYGLGTLDGYHLEVARGNGGGSSINNAPTVTLKYAPAVPTIDDTVQLIATASDPDGDAITYQWRVDGSLAGYSSDTSTISIDGLFLDVGEHTIEVKALDGKGESATATVSFTLPQCWIKVFSGQVKLNDSLLENSVRTVPVSSGDKIEAMPYDSGTQLQAPNVAVLRYADGAIVKIKSGTIMQILSGGFRIFIGRTWIKLTKHGWRFTAMTPNDSIGIRGTILEVSVDEIENTTINVFEGIVDVSDVNSLKTVSVGAGQTAVCGNDGIPSDPISFNESSLFKWYEDMDNDGINDVLEGFEEEGRSIDTSDDGLPDYLDPRIVHFLVDNGTGTMTLETSNGILSHCTIIDEQNRIQFEKLPDNLDFKWGFIDFTIIDWIEHESVQISLQLPEELDDATQYWMVVQDEYIPLSNVQVDGQSITFTLSDTNGDGVIRNIGAAGTPKVEPYSGESGGGGCFISTLGSIIGEKM